jgi:hypothetical protein
MLRLSVVNGGENVIGLAHRPGEMIVHLTIQVKVKRIKHSRVSRNAGLLAVTKLLEHALLHDMHHVVGQLRIASELF